MLKDSSMESLLQDKSASQQTKDQSFIHKMSSTNTNYVATSSKSGTISALSQERQRLDLGVFCRERKVPTSVPEDYVE